MSYSMTRKTSPAHVVTVVFDRQAPCIYKTRLEARAFLQAFHDHLFSGIHLSFWIGSSPSLSISSLILAAIYVHHLYSVHVPLKFACRAVPECGFCNNLIAWAIAMDLDLSAITLGKFVRILIVESWYSNLLDHWVSFARQQKLTRK